MMNKTEEKAYKWLQHQGYRNITFRSRESPDFITEEGEGFEVKKARNNSIWFSPNQFATLKKIKNTVLVFNGGDEPIAIIPFNEISDGEQYWRNIRIAAPLTISVPIKISPETKKRLDELRHQGQTYDGIIKELIDEVEETQKGIKEGEGR